MGPFGSYEPRSRDVSSRNDAGGSEVRKGRAWEGGRLPDQTSSTASIAPRETAISVSSLPAGRR